MPHPMMFDDERSESSFSTQPLSVRSRWNRHWLFGTAGASLLGAVFAAFSTSDFISHLDRQVHSVHCSFIPGAGAQIGESGCRTVMLSPYSSLLRTSLWGGLPISLLALAVFAYLVYRSIEFALRDGVTKRDTAFLVAATLLPVGMSVLYGGISIAKLDTLCKLCVGVYVSSTLAFVFAGVAHARANEERSIERWAPRYARWFLEGVAYVLALVLLYALLAPVSRKSVDGCGALAKKDDPSGVLIALGDVGRGAPGIAVLDPLCPACKGFDERLEVSGLASKLSLRALLFPLDASCNWMLKRSLHPGACAVSEAMLCSKSRAREILSWAFLNQEDLTKEAENGDAPVRKRLAEKFPEVKGCLGSPTVKSKLNKSLRWAVANALPVLTPQLFIGDRRVCDEDTDLGLEYTVTAMLSAHGSGRR